MVYAVDRFSNDEPNVGTKEVKNLKDSAVNQ